MLHQNPFQNMYRGFQEATLFSRLQIREGRQNLQEYLSQRRGQHEFHIGRFFTITHRLICHYLCGGGGTMINYHKKNLGEKYVKDPRNA